MLLGDALQFQMLLLSISYLLDILCYVYLKSLMPLTHSTGDTALVLLPDTKRGGKGLGGALLGPVGDC